jgi:hypothetical protein
MSKELIIFVWPQLDDDSYGQASFVFGVGHSIPYATSYPTEASHVAAASIILIEEGPKAEARRRRHRDNISLQFGPTET